MRAQKNKVVIYETRGRAREFNDLAINLFAGCGHGCLYCYAPMVTHVDAGEFVRNPRPRLTPSDIERSAAEWGNNSMIGKHDKRPVLLCFVTDPYQPIEAETKLTRTAIEILHRAGLRVSILTKGGERSMRDFDLLGPSDAYATTLTCIPGDEERSAHWEPGADWPSGRIEALRQAYRQGVETWVSLEPVIYPYRIPELVRMTRAFVGHYKIGRLNYHEHAAAIDWKAFGWRTKAFLDRMGVKYMIKKDLWDSMGLKDAGGSTGPRDIGVKLHGQA